MNRRLSLKQFVPNGKVSTGIMAKWQGKWVLAMTQEKYWYKEDGVLHVSLVCLGGKQEGDESLPEALAREVAEEALSSAKIYNCPTTVFLWSDETQETRTLELDEPAPFLIWNTDITLKDLNGTPYVTPYINAVYHGRLMKAPTPNSEIPGVVFLTSNDIQTIYHDSPISPHYNMLLDDNTVLQAPFRFILMGSALFTTRLNLLPSF